MCVGKRRRRTRTFDEYMSMSCVKSYESFNRDEGDMNEIIAYNVEKDLLQNVDRSESFDQITLLLIQKKRKEKKFSACK